VLGQAVDKKDGGHHDDDEPDHQPGETIDALIEGRGHAPARDFIGKLPKKGMRSGAHDDSSRKAADDIGAHEAHVRQIERILDLLLV